MLSSRIAWAGAAALGCTGMLIALGGCDNQPQPRPPTAVASVGANYHPGPPSVGVLSPAPAPGKRDAAAAAMAATTPGTSTTPDMGMMGTTDMTGTMTTPPLMATPTMATPATTDTGGVVLDKVGQNLVKGMGPQLTAFAAPTAAHHKLAFAIGKGIAGDGTGPGGQPIKYLGFAVQATYPYILAKIKPDLKVDEALLAAAESEFKSKIDALKKSDDTGGAAFGTLQAFAFGTASLNDSNECYQGLVALKVVEVPVFPDLSVDAVRTATSDVVKIVVPNAKDAGLEMTLPSELKPAI